MEGRLGQSSVALSRVLRRRRRVSSDMGAPRGSTEPGTRARGEHPLPWPSGRRCAQEQLPHFFFAVAFFFIAGFLAAGFFVAAFFAMCSGPFRTPRELSALLRKARTQVNGFCPWRERNSEIARKIFPRRHEDVERRGGRAEVREQRSEVRSQRQIRNWGGDGRVNLRRRGGAGA